MFTFIRLKTIQIILKIPTELNFFIPLGKLIQYNLLKINTQRYYLNNKTGSNFYSIGKFYKKNIL